MEQKPGTQLCFFDICVGLVGVAGLVLIVATPTLGEFAPNEPVRELPMRVSLARAEIGTHGLPILSRLERMMSWATRYPGRYRDESSLLPQKPDPQCFFFDKHRLFASDHRILGHSLFSSFPSPHHPEVAPSGPHLATKA